MEANCSTVERIILCKPRGFCAGVVRAVKMLENAVEMYGTPLYVLREIVHNVDVIENFRKHGVSFVGSVDQVPFGSRWSLAHMASRPRCGKRQPIATYA